jgi:hypothetical protein
MLYLNQIDRSNKQKMHDKWTKFKLYLNQINNALFNQTVPCQIY